MTDNSWAAHIAYLEEEVEKTDQRAARLEEALPGLQDVQKKREVQAMILRLRAETKELRKYLKVMKPAGPPDSCQAQ